MKKEADSYDRSIQAKGLDTDITIIESANRYTSDNCIDIVVLLLITLFVVVLNNHLSESRGLEGDFSFVFETRIIIKFKNPDPIQRCSR